MRVALDVTPLRGFTSGRATGVGRVVAGVLDALPAAAPDIAIVPWELTRHGRHLPPSVLVRLWAHGDVPSGRGIVPPADVVHGTNFVVPPAARPAVVTVYDCWCARQPRTCDPTIAAAVATVRGAVRRGAWVHVTSETAAEEVRELFGAERVAVSLAASPVPAGTAARRRALRAGHRHHRASQGLRRPRARRRRSGPAPRAGRGRGRGRAGRDRRHHRHRSPGHPPARSTTPRGPSCCGAQRARLPLAG